MPRWKPWPDRFWSNVEPQSDGCWLWTGLLYSNGYGHVWKDGHALAHRVAYQLLVGPIPVGLDIDHLCRNRACVNPHHMEPVTRQTNLLRGIGLPAIHARKTHCVHGHALSQANTYTWHGQRKCRACHAAQERRRKAEHRAVG